MIFENGSLRTFYRLKSMMIKKLRKKTIQKSVLKL